MTAATWLTSGWVDAAMIAGWMVAVLVIGARAWRRADPDEPEREP